MGSQEATIFKFIKNSQTRRTIVNTTKLDAISFQIELVMIVIAYPKKMSSQQVLINSKKE